MQRTVIFGGILMLVSDTDTDTDSNSALGDRLFREFATWLLSPAVQLMYSVSARCYHIHFLPIFLAYLDLYCHQSWTTFFRIT